MKDGESNRRRAPGVHIPLISTVSDNSPRSVIHAKDLETMIIVVAVGPGSWNIVVAPEHGDCHTYHVTVDPAK